LKVQKGSSSVVFMAELRRQKRWSDEGSKRKIHRHGKDTDLGKGKKKNVRAQMQGKKKKPGGWTGSENGRRASWGSKANPKSPRSPRKNE